MLSASIRRRPQTNPVSLNTRIFKVNTIPSIFHLPRLFSTTPAMSSSTKEWLVTIPDKPNALQKRLAIRPTHLENITPLVEVGQIVLGGAMLTEHPPVDGTPDMTGSVMIFKAESESEVRRMLEKDVYTTGDVWDLERVRIQAFKSAIRKEL